MVAQHYRWDFVGLSTDTKPTPETSEKVVDGSTFYCSDTSKLYVFCKTRWYERKALGGGGGGGGTSYTAGNGIDITDDVISVDTETIQPKLTAGSNVSISAQNVISATDTKYTAGLNITISDNTISATDTTYSAFTGTDGTTAGTSGLVPAPATTDAGKFLKADGTWDTAGGAGGGVTKLTSADYNYPADNPTTIYLPLLPEGFYTPADNTVRVQDINNNVNKASRLYYVSNANTSDVKSIYMFYGEGNITSNILSPINVWEGSSTTGYLTARHHLVDDSELSQYHKAGTSDPTSISGAELGCIYVNTTTDTAFVCVDNTGSQIWKQITS